MRRQERKKGRGKSFPAESLIPGWSDYNASRIIGEESVTQQDW